MRIIIAAAAAAAALAFSAPAAVGGGAARAAPPEPLDIEREPAFLLTQPHFDGTPLARAVVLVAPIRGGHVGVILNRPLESLTLAMLFPDDEPSRAVKGPMYLGGPHRREVVVAMLRAEHAPAPPPKSHALMAGVWLVFDSEAIDEVIRTRPNEARYYVGFNVWEPGELAAQIARGYYAAVRADAARVFLEDTSGLHQELAPRLAPAGARRISY